MRKKSKTFYRALSSLLLMLIMIGTLATIPLRVSAADVTKVEKSYDIAVVFDNSGSMYYQSYGWCRAKYAMEIFASMLNYDKDKLYVYPMWEVTTDGSQPSSGGSYAPIEIKSKSDIDKISNLYTVNPSNTPFAPITEAYEYLSGSSNANEKWLIILTDGAFNQDARGQGSNFDLQARVSGLASDDVKIQYLGFDGAMELQADEANNFFAKKSSDVSLKDDLIDICNLIFQRSVLPSDRLNGEVLNLDLSMKNVIVFAQGENAKITSLKDSNGNEVAISLDSGQRRYSNIKATGYAQALVDTSLAGQVVTFSGCPKGEYTLSYSGADTIEIFYEPNVDVDISFVNSDGQIVDNSDDFVSGEYTVSSKIVDASTGEDVTSHELMGKDVELKTYVKKSNDSGYTEYPEEATITFEPNESVDIYIEGKYLEKYKITSKDDSRFDWLTGLYVKKSSVDIKLSVSAEQTWYKLKDHDEWKPVKISLLIDGQPLTEEQLASIDLTITASGDLKYRCEPIQGESAYNVYIAQNESGEYTEPNTGKYKLSATATYVDEYDNEVKAQEVSVEFEIGKYGAFLSWLIRNLWWILLILALFLIWLFYMLQKSLPKMIVKDTASFTSISTGELDSEFVEVLYARKGKILTINGPSAVDFGEQCSVTFDLRAVDNHFTKSNRRRVAVIGIDSPCDEMKVAGTKYINYDGQWMKSTDVRNAERGQSIAPINQELSCAPRFELSRSDGVATLVCKIKTIK